MGLNKATNLYFKHEECLNWLAVFQNHVYVLFELASKQVITIVSNLFYSYWDNACFNF